MIWMSTQPQVKPTLPQPALGLTPLLLMGLIKIGHWRWRDRKSTRLNSSHTVISYAVFCLKKKNNDVDPSRSQVSHEVGSLCRRPMTALPSERPRSGAIWSPRVYLSSKWLGTGSAALIML